MSTFVDWVRASRKLPVAVITTAMITMIGSVTACAVPNTRPEG